ncbi:MAG: MFS transporter [Anaerolineaceae bacterium]|nr:MFS transporter [Anaerolineaceae bacterium]
MQITKKTPLTNINYPWMVVWVTFLVAVAGSLIANKVSPIMPPLMKGFNIGLSQAGLLTFAVSLTSLVIAIPAGMLVQKVGVRNTGLLGLIALIAGALLGAATDSFWVLFISRILEGFGVALLTIVPPTAIALWFAPEKSGLPMGIWSTATPIGAFLAMAIAPALEIQIGWVGVWLASAGFALASLMVFILLIRPNPKGKSETSEPSFVNYRAIMANKKLWLLGLSMTMYSFSYMPVIIYYPTYLNDVFNMPLIKAGLLVGIISLVAIAGSPFLGWLSDKLNARKWIIVAGYLILIPITALVFWIPEGWMSLAMVCAVPTLIYTAAPETVKDPGSVSLSLGVVTSLMYLGTMVSIPLFGYLVEIFGWFAASTINVAAAVLGLVLVLMNREMK